VTRRPTILYAGTYERDYPRNQQLIRLLRKSDCTVIEIHEPFWERVRDKSRGFTSPASITRSIAQLLLIYVRLIVRMILRLKSADAVAIGYIGQIDMLVLGTIARLLGRPVLFNPLVTLTDTVVEDRSMAGKKTLMARAIWITDWLALHIASVVVTDTRQNAEYIAEMFGVRHSRIHALHVGADEEVFRHRTFDAGRQNGLNVLFYGKMIPLHGIETILEAAKILHDSGNPDVQFEIIGTGQQEHLVHSFLAANQEIVMIHRPWVAYRRLSQRIANADVVLGIFGGSEKSARVVPNKVFQAMAVGAPIITRDSEAIRDVLEHGASGWLVPASNPVALAEAIRQLMDPALRSSLGKSARSAFDRHGSDRAVCSSLSRALDLLVPTGSDCSSSGRCS
jgi:glycosyltransferase involved in cell wall biosynthesis